MPDDRPMQLQILYPRWDTQGVATRVFRLETGAPRLRGGGPQTTTGQYSRIQRTSLTSNGIIDTTTSFVLKKGGAVPSANISGFAYTSTANSITWYWDGTNGSKVIIIHRSDGTNFVIPTFGSGLTITGLLNATTYYFLPFWSPNNLCNIGWVTGTTGSPQIAFVVADTTASNGSFFQLQQTLQQREPLTSGYMTATTGSSGGGGGGGGGGTCVMGGTEIVPCGGLKYDIAVHSENQWMYLKVDDGRELKCTLNHPLYREDSGRCKAEELSVGDAIIMDDGVRYVSQVDQFRKMCSKWHVRMPDGHLYYANGYLSHNAKPFIP